MITSTNEFGAPWNDQFYRIYFHFEFEQDEIGFFFLNNWKQKLHCLDQKIMKKII